MNKLKTWDELKTVPPDQLKKIKGGRLSGMTDIKPQWRLMAMTKEFGPCGIGWKYIVVNKWIEEGSEGQKVAFVDVELFIKVDGEWSDSIPGNGGSMFIAKEKSGPYTSDEAYKMATTDALSVAMKNIGVAADIYMGYWDGSKYNIPQEPKIEKKALTPDAPQTWERAIVSYKEYGSFEHIEKSLIISKEHKDMIIEACKGGE